MQKPILLTLDEPTQKAKETLAEYVTFSNNLKSEFSMIYTQFTPIECSNFPVFCPCTSIEHISSEKVFYLDDNWKQNEGLQITSTPEHTWSLLLQLAKLKRMQISGKRLGIIGFGRIGHAIIRYAYAFGMGIAVNDIKVYENPYILYSVYREEFGLNVEYKCLECILETSDIISINVPLNDSTRGMISKEQFDMMKPDVLLINTSRAEIVDKRSLVSALTGKKIGGYADDFVNDRVIFHPRVIQTNHIGGNCYEARELTDCYIAAQIIKYIEGEIK